METIDEIHCPKCNSTQLTANKKGFSGVKAVAGVALTGGIGLLAGTIGSKKVLITCLNCGKQFKPGEGNKPTRELTSSGGSFKNEMTSKEKKQSSILLICLFLPLTLISFYFGWGFVSYIFAILLFIGLITMVKHR